MTTFAEKFIRAYAKLAVEAITVSVDRETNGILLSFHDRTELVSMKDIALQEDAFRRLGEAVNRLLGIPAKDQPSET